MKQIPINDEVRSALEGLFEAFKVKFGREPGPGDPVFFDPDASEPCPFDEAKMQEEISKVMRFAGVDPAMIHAYEKTGRIVTSENIRFLSRTDLDEWQDAIDEYRSVHSVD